MRNKVIIALIVAVVVLSGCGSQKLNESSYYYDNNNNLVRQAGSDPASLADFQRRVVVKGFDTSDNGAEVFANFTLGWAVKEQDKEVVVGPLDALYVDTYFGRIAAWRIPEIVLKAYLLPSSKENGEPEELGDISVNEDMDLFVAERTAPAIGIRTDYVAGKYEGLAVGDSVYLTSQVNGRINVWPSYVTEIYVDKSGRNLFNAFGGETGSLAFAIYKGKFELVGFLSAMEPAEQESGSVYLYYQDVRQVINFIKSSPSR